MTVTYTSEVADCKGFGNFWRLLFRWRGSVYKLVWIDLLAYIFIYLLLSVVYRTVLVEEQRRLFEKVSLLCNYYSDFIPISFVLGFYVSIVMKRWWDQYLSLLWPDSLALFVSTSIHGHDRQGRLMRRTILRYVNLSFVLTLTMITPRAKKRFPTMDHLVEAGFMTSNEKMIFSTMVEKTPHALCYVPLVWAGTLVSRARREGRIRDDFAVKTIIDELNNLRVKINSLISYDWISIPLVYTQVVSLSVYSFFLSTIMGRQFLDPQQKYPKNDIDFYFPFFTMLQFFFYMGWLKVAETLVNPFGEDDDDFEVNWLIDRNIQVSYLIVDEMHSEHPELTQDLYWDEVFPQELPYTVAAEQYKRDPPLGSTANLRVSEAGQELLMPVLEEEPEEPYNASMSGGKTGAATTAGVGRVNSVRSFGSSLSGHKSFLSMLQNRLRRGDLRSSSSSQASVRRRRIRSASQCDSHVSDVSFTSSNMRRNNTNASLQESGSHRSQASINTETDGDGVPGCFLSSSPKAVRKKTTLPPLATISSSASTPSSCPSPAQASKNKKSLRINVSCLQLHVDGQQQDSSEGHQGQDSPCESTSSTYTSVFSSQVFQPQENLGEQGAEGDHSISGVESRPSRSCTRTVSVPADKGTVTPNTAQDHTPRLQETQGETDLPWRSWHSETWEV